MAKASRHNRVRIIGGQWRGRYLEFDDADGLRPTGDRIRETLFNWLQADINGSRCLDLFAGSGAIGFEAASRGAKSVLLVEQNPTVCKKLSSEVNRLDDRSVLSVRQGNALQLLAAGSLTPANTHGSANKGSAANGIDASGELSKFDLVFADPPFAGALQLEVLERLADATILADQALLYLETPRADMPSVLPAPWQYYKIKKAGAVAAALLHL